MTKPDSFYNLFASVRVMRAAFSDAYKRVCAYKRTYSSQSEMSEDQKRAFSAAFDALDAAVVHLDEATQSIDRAFREARK